MRTQDDLLKEIVEYFKLYIFENHVNTCINTHNKLKSYKINPIVVKYLSLVIYFQYFLFYCNRIILN